MRICKCAVLFLFLSVSVHAYSYAYKVTEVYIKRSVSVSSGTILLGEIARIEGEDTNLRERINRVEIGRSPLPGRKRDISKDTIMCRLRQDNVDLSKISIQSSDTITVLRRCQRITKQEIKRIARSFITNNLTFVPEVVKINSVIARHEVILPTGEIKYSVIVPEYGSLVGKVHFTIVFEVDGTVEGSVLVNADVEVLTQVVVAARRLKRYHVVLEDDVKLENRRVRNIHAITNLDEVIGKRTKSVITTGTPLKMNHIEIPPLVKRGQLVTILAKSPSFRITTLGKAREDGHKGEKIKVVNLSSHKEIHAEVVDGTLVKVSF